MSVYWTLEDHYGYQDWWPAETPFEVAVGAILTQNTAWSNVEKAIVHLKHRSKLTPANLSQLSRSELADLIRPSGYFNIKEQRIRNLVSVLMHEFDGSIDSMAYLQEGAARERLLSINGIGEETADSILLYALDKQSFVVDAYTRRVASRHGLVADEAAYPEIKFLYESNLDPSVALYQEYHALLVAVGKDFCKPTPRCEGCPLKKYL